MERVVIFKNKHTNGCKCSVGVRLIFSSGDARNVIWNHLEKEEWKQAAERKLKVKAKDSCGS